MCLTSLPPPQTQLSVHVAGDSLHCPSIYLLTQLNALPSEWETACLGLCGGSSIQPASFKFAQAIGSSLPTTSCFRPLSKFQITTRLPFQPFRLGLPTKHPNITAILCDQCVALQRLRPTTARRSVPFGLVRLPRVCPRSPRYDRLCGTKAMHALTPPFSRIGIPQEEREQ